MLGQSWGAAPVQEQPRALHQGPQCFRIIIIITIIKMHSQRNDCNSSAEVSRCVGGISVVCFMAGLVFSPLSRSLSVSEIRIASAAFRAEAAARCEDVPCSHSGVDN